jgi:hypothetical protein
MATHVQRHYWLLGRHLGFGFRRLNDKRQGRFIWFFCDYSSALIQAGCSGRHLGFGFRRFSDQSLGWLVRFFGGSLGVTGGRFLSMTSVAAHPIWPLRQPSWIWFPSIIWWTPASTCPIFWWLIGGHQSSPCSTSSIHPHTTSHSGAYATSCVAIVNEWMDQIMVCWCM